MPPDVVPAALLFLDERWHMRNGEAGGGGMTLNQLVIALAVLLGGAVVLFQLLVYILGQQWASLYGEASLALVLALPLGFVLVRRLRTLGHSAFWSLLALVPIVLAAIGQIAFWQVFFSAHKMSIVLNLLRENVLRLSDIWLPGALAIGGIVVALLVYKLVQPRTPKAG